MKPGSPLYRNTTLLISFLWLVANCAQAQNKLQKLKEVSKVKRNVIFILTDDHRYDFMGFTGKLPWLKTPYLDELAQKGVYLKNSFVTTSLCSPSRASILTGQYSHVHTIVDNVTPEPEGLTYFPQYLQRAGYQTAFLGKWHMGQGDQPRKGFNHWESFPGQGVYYNPVLNINGKRITYKDSTYITDLLTQHSLTWLKNRDKSKPFFLYLSHKAVHSPVTPAKRHKGMYKNQYYPLPETYYQTLGNDYKKLGWPEWTKQQRYSWHGVDYMYHNHQNLESLVQSYCETLMAVDESVKSLMDYLKTEGLDKSTLVVYMGDNGFSWGEHGLIDKRHFYEESVKVPMIAYCPELFKGGTIEDRMVQNIDVAPTILQCAGLEKPGHMTGQSFIPLLQGKTTQWRDKIFYEYFWEYDFPMTPTVFGVRTDKYKYIRYWGIWDTNELYDLENDPNEVTNLIANPKYTTIAKNMAEDLLKWLEETKGMQIPLRPITKRPLGDYLHPYNR